MDSGGHLYKASSGSLRVPISSSRWSNNSMGAFSRSSSREEDDKEALKWAALERLPTFDPLRKGIMTTLRGGANEIDVSNLELLERRKLIERLVNVEQVNNDDKYLFKLKNRFDGYGLDVKSLLWKWQGGSNASYFVKVIGSLFSHGSKTKQIFKEGLQVVLCRGDRIRLWQDIRQDGIPLSELFPRIYALADDNKDSVQDFGHWNNFMFKGQEAIIDKAVDEVKFRVA
ncbi:hypothetical protein Ddye_011320 [Dipteronia dyeriana]|uniref:Uncharacterized protein n=1 Tax=Dipteronia dyeriana TaxID=168575 RepID=A0AAD9X2B2_9ROSI|nr:hypothetical protein Ddye_011320 [Dipteronia dyeriana]